MDDANENHDAPGGAQPVNVLLTELGAVTELIAVVPALRVVVPALRVVVPERWEEICLDRFVFGWVAAAAFARHQPLRLTAQGIVFELEQLDDAELQNLGDYIDKEADKAIRIKEGLVRARAVFDEVDGVRRR